MYWLKFNWSSIELQFELSLDWNNAKSPLYVLTALWSVWLISCPHMAGHVIVAWCKPDNDSYVCRKMSHIVRRWSLSYTTYWFIHCAHMFVAPLCFGVILQKLHHCNSNQCLILLPISHVQYCCINLCCTPFTAYVQKH